MYSEELNQPAKDMEKPQKVRSLGVFLEYSVGKKAAKNLVGSHEKMPHCLRPGYKEEDQYKYLPFKSPSSDLPPSDLKLTDLESLFIDKNSANNCILQSTSDNHDGVKSHYMAIEKQKEIIQAIQIEIPGQTIDSMLTKYLSIYQDLNKFEQQLKYGNFNNGLITINQQPGEPGTFVDFMKKQIRLVGWNLGFNQDQKYLQQMQNALEAYMQECQTISDSYNQYVTSHRLPSHEKGQQYLNSLQKAESEPLEQFNAVAKAIVADPKQSVSRLFKEVIFESREILTKYNLIKLELIRKFS